MITAWRIFVDEFFCVEFTIYAKMHQEILMTYLYYVVFFRNPKKPGNNDQLMGDMHSKLN